MGNDIRRYPQDALSLKELATGNKKRARKKVNLAITKDEQGVYHLTGTVPAGAKPLQSLETQVAACFEDKAMVGPTLLTFNMPANLRVDDLAPGQKFDIVLPEAPMTHDQTTFKGYHVVGYAMTGPAGNTREIVVRNLKPLGMSGDTFIQDSSVVPQCVSNMLAKCFRPKAKKAAKVETVAPTMR